MEAEIQIYVHTVKVQAKRLDSPILFYISKVLLDWDSHWDNPSVKTFFA